MATVEASPGHHPSFSMSARRLPLANNPTAINSPARPAASLKRPRSTGKEDRDGDVTRSPLKKRLLHDLGNQGQHHVSRQDDHDGRIFNGKTVQPTAFQQKLVAAKDGRRVGSNGAPESKSHATASDMDTIRLWRRHYRKAFPDFVFYFESLPPDVCIRASRQIHSLGSREEKFFSKDVTHIVTTRAVPEVNAEPTGATRTSHGQPRTINPSLLDKHGQTEAKGIQQRARFALDLPCQKRALGSMQPASNNDVLHKAKEMGMKIWALEKFERMMNTMFNIETGNSPDNRKNYMTYVPLKAPKETDLTQLLQEEKKVTTSRAPWSEIVPFQGYYIYVHDMDEKTRPVMYREYEKPTIKEDGEWPMFRNTSKGRCPFVEEPEHVRQQLKERERRAKAQQAMEQRERQQPRTRAAVAAVEAAKEKAVVADGPQALAESQDAGNRMPKPAVPASQSKAADPPKLDRNTSGNFDSMPSLVGSAHANFRGLAGNPGGEPMASGIQVSNATSAIRSQMISSTAANPGARAGTTKEMYQLQRRVFEKPGTQSTNPSSHVSDVRASNLHEQIPARRTTRSQATEKLARIHEDETLSDEDSQGRVRRHEMPPVKKQKVVVKREPKPGYCENCKDKYDDFQDHVVSRKHRKFAMACENFKDLDNLLSQLVRPLR